MICDRQGTLWFGSFYEGVSYYNTEAETYFYYTPETEAEGKLNSPLSNSVSEDSVKKRYRSSWYLTPRGFRRILLVRQPEIRCSRSLSWPNPYPWSSLPQRT